MRLNEASLRWVLGTVAVPIVLAGCGTGTEDNNTATAAAPAGNSAVPAAGGTKLTGAGSTFINPLMSQWASSYNQAKGVQINYQSIGSGGGIQQLKNKTVDFGASDAPMSDKDLKTMPGPIVQIPACAGAVAVAYNLKGIDTGLHLSGPVLAKIFLGTIKTWNDPAITALNAGKTMPATPIEVAHRSDGSGTTNIFTTYLMKASPEWTPIGAGKAVKWPIGVGGKGNDGVAGVVKQSDGAIGYVELAYAMQNKLTFAAIQNKAQQFVAPSVASTTAAVTAGAADLAKDVRTPIVDEPGAQAYPIAGMTYVMLYTKSQDATRGKALLDFLNWATHDGQKMSEALYYAPLPEAVATLNDAALKTVQ